jgi:hypothetical protein
MAVVLRQFDYEGSHRVEIQCFIFTGLSASAMSYEYESNLDVSKKLDTPAVIVWPEYSDVKVNEIERH